MPSSILSHYPYRPDSYDELFGEDGVRPHWQEFLDHIDESSADVLKARAAQLARGIQQNGVTYNVYADPRGTDRPWSLDLLPLILPTEEWRGISAAISQRVRLLDALLGDLYGDQTTLAEGLLPPELVFGHKGFHWPCKGIKPAGGAFLHLYAADLARSPDGHWWVIADRTQSPSGAGYALENRLLVSRAFPDLFRDLQVQTLAGFFRGLQRSLGSQAPTDGEHPLTVLLTPGPFNETYFEHVYLARYLGFPLVEGQDLTVRHDTVYLKTVSGLKRVHAILRRLDDDFCDPVELRADSALGVPGLLGAVRAGRVLVANALGSGLLESAALPGFLPGISRHLLGEELMMPSVATWWCGEEPAKAVVLKHLRELVIKPTFPGGGSDVIFGDQLDAPQLAALAARIEADPSAFVAQELVKLSRAPAWTGGHRRKLMTRAMGLRVYAAITPEGYSVLPGGLARVAGMDNTRILTMQKGGSSKDTWVPSDGPVSTFSLLQNTLRVSDLIGETGTLSSRLAENLFWFGRYGERCDAVARLARLALSRLSEGRRTERAGALSVMLDLAAGAGLIEGEVSATPLAKAELDLFRAVLDRRAECGLAANLQRLTWCATQAREHLSLDHWHALKRLSAEIESARGRVSDVSALLEFLDEALTTFVSLSGFAMDNMTRDMGWRLHIVGRRLERLDNLSGRLARFLRRYAEVAGPLHRELAVEALLELCDSIITYRTRYRAQPELLPAMHLLTMDDANPHALAFQARMLSNYLKTFETDGVELGVAELDRAFGAVQAFPWAHLESLCPEPERREAVLQLADLLDHLARAGRHLSDRLAMRFFSHVGIAGQATFAA
ncbi:circularly permuted type 2 ATP-grasp protein [Zoogloea dura]|uniref:Circularly permuted type 2 ATP-grasp protein n=1 Tax=Zoogloea dura TaxID=2728840 RepID=A0A848FYT3_9RHOO|nr:circularly permuted type 2 ATP-grasp protein [Zoogloea dura]NML25077.1 circularly permuted type 2 ATP-grasp protein [Zoogloea dura]